MTDAAGSTLASSAIPRPLPPIIVGVSLLACWTSHTPSWFIIQGKMPATCIDLDHWMKALPTNPQYGVNRPHRSDEFKQF